MSDTVNHLFMWDNKRVWHCGGDAIKALSENFYDPQIGVHWIQTNWEVIHLMPVQIWHGWIFIVAHYIICEQMSFHIHFSFHSFLTSLIFYWNILTLLLV